jgi:hypothetical protein
VLSTKDIEQNGPARMGVAAQARPMPKFERNLNPEELARRTITED